MNTTNDYGWQSAEGPTSCNYLAPAVLDLLRDLSPRRGSNSRSSNVLARIFFWLALDDSPDQLLADTPQGFDVGVSTEVIEHPYAPRRLPAFAHSMLGDGGHLVLTTPYPGHLKNLAISMINGWDRPVDPLWDGGHIKLFSRRPITHLLEEAGFHIIRFGGVGRVPNLWKSMLVVAVKR